MIFRPLLGGAAYYHMENILAQKLAAASGATLTEVDTPPLSMRLRDATMVLFLL